MKRILLIITVVFSLFALSGCKSKNDEESIDIVVTNFVQYSITKEIVKNYCNVKMVLRPGQDSHSFDPTINVVITINQADMFIYTSEHVETWAEKIISKLKEDGPNVIESASGIEFKKSVHEHNDGHTHEEGEDHSSDEHSFDPHIWTSLKNTIVMVQNIANAIISLDPDNKEYYYHNSQEYIARLTMLENEYSAFFSSISDPKVFFVSPFSFLYLCDEYDIEYISLYSTCSTEVEPSATALINIIEQIKKYGAKYIYKKELVSSDVADKIAEVTGTKVLTLHSADNVSVEEYKNGVTYYDIMESNLNLLKKGLS